MPGELFVIIDAPEASQPLPRGLYTLEEGSEGAATLTHTVTSRKVPLENATLVRDGTTLDLKALGYKLRLQSVGKPKLTLSEWEQIRTLFVGHPIRVSRIPTGTTTAVHLVALDVSKTGVTLRYKDATKGSSTLQLLGYTAFTWSDDILEARTPPGLGISLQLRTCGRCGLTLIEPVARLDEVEYCNACITLIRKEGRSMAQRKVGVCRGCAFYGLVNSGEGSRDGVCLNEARVKALGQLTNAPVRRCTYRRSRAKGASRTKVDALPPVRSSDASKDVKPPTSPKTPLEKTARPEPAEKAKAEPAEKAKAEPGEKAPKSEPSAKVPPKTEPAEKAKAESSEKATKSDSGEKMQRPKA